MRFVGRKLSLRILNYWWIFTSDCAQSCEHTSHISSVCHIHKLFLIHSLQKLSSHPGEELGQHHQQDASTPHCPPALAKQKLCWGAEAEEGSIHLPLCPHHGESLSCLSEWSWNVGSVSPRKAAGMAIDCIICAGCTVIRSPSYLFSS